MVLDTFAAGSFVSTLVEKREISSDQIRALERLKDRTGLHVLMGSAADAVSYEVSRYEQGLLTNALLQGMRGAALRDEVFVYVSPLFQYVADSVPTLAGEIGGIQRPLIALPRDARSFDIGLLRREDRNAIPLVASKPLLLRPAFLNSDRHWDVLKLAENVRERLCQARGTSLRGERGRFPAVYLSADELPGAIRPTGAYSVSGDAMTMSLGLVKDGKELTSLQIQGFASDLGGLARRIVEEIVDGLRTIH